MTLLADSGGGDDRTLATFIGQELERWGFAVEPSDGDGRKLIVNADGYEFRVEVTRFR